MVEVAEMVLGKSAGVDGNGDTEKVSPKEIEDALRKTNEDTAAAIKRAALIKDMKNKFSRK